MSRQVEVAKWFTAPRSSCLLKPEYKTRFLSTVLDLDQHSATRRSSSSVDFTQFFAGLPRPSKRALVHVFLNAC